MIASDSVASGSASRPLYQESSQFRHWRFSAAKLASLRSELNLRAVTVVKKNMRAEAVHLQSVSVAQGRLLTRGRSDLSCYVQRRRPKISQSLRASCRSRRPRPPPHPPRRLRLQQCKTSLPCLTSSRPMNFFSFATIVQLSRERALGLASLRASRRRRRATSSASIFGTRQWTTIRAKSCASLACQPSALAPRP